MKTVLIHKMRAGLGEIFSSWYSLINIALVQKSKGHKVQLVVDCSDCQDRYLNSETVKLFFDLYTFRKLYFDDIIIPDTSYDNVIDIGWPNTTEYRFGIQSNDLQGLEHLYELTADRIYSLHDNSIIYPNLVTSFVKEYYTNFIKANNIEVNNAHHIRVIDGYERTDEALPIVELVLPNLNDGDLVVSNSSEIKRIVKENTDKKVIEYDNPIEEILTNHFNRYPIDRFPNDLLLIKTLMAYTEMKLLGTAKHFYRYSIYPNYNSGFLVFPAINKVEITYKLIPREYIPGPWIGDALRDPADAKKWERLYP